MAAEFDCAPNVPGGPFSGGMPSVVPSNGALKVAKHSRVPAHVDVESSGGQASSSLREERQRSDSPVREKVLQVHSASAEQVSKQLDAAVRARFHAKDAKAKANEDVEASSTRGAALATALSLTGDLQCPKRFPHPRLARYTNNGKMQGTRIGSTALNGDVLLYDVDDGSRVAIKRTPLEYTRLLSLLRAHIKAHPSHCTCEDILAATRQTSAAQPSPNCISMRLSVVDQNHTSLENAVEEVRMFQWLSQQSDLSASDNAEDSDATAESNTQTSHVVRLRDSFYDERFLYAVFDLCNGGELYSYVQNTGPLAEAFAKHVFRQLLEGTDYVHSKGICILDISPENVLFRRPVPASVTNGDVKASFQEVEAVIIDLGLARWMRTPAEQEASRSEKQHAVSECSFMFPAGGRRGGKITYMAPEYFSARAFDGRKADAFSLGVTLFVMLFGIPPFETPCMKDRRFALVSSNRAMALLKAWKLSDVVSSEAVSFLEGLLCADPSKRLGLKEARQHAWLS